METNPVDFSNVYIERCDKETENFLAEEGQAFLQNQINYLRVNKNEFVYIEATPFSELGADGLSLEVDDVFGTYNVMLGLKLPKKLEPQIKAFLEHHLSGEEIKYGLLFDANDGLWNLNFTLDYVAGYREETTFSAALIIIHEFLLKLVAEVR